MDGLENDDSQFSSFDRRTHTSARTNMQSIKSALLGTYSLVTQIFTPAKQPTGLVPLEGRVAIVTGANIGCGFETARSLAGLGAHVVLACRNSEKGEAAVQAIRSEFPSSQVELQLLDLQSLASIRDFAQAANKKFPKIHLLVNNAGVMVPPFGHTADGFETQFGTNYVGPFYLTLLLLDNIVAAGTPERVARIVNVSSAAYHGGSINFDDLNSEKSYDRLGAYAQSKLANILFSGQLQQLLTARKANVASHALHPGVVNTGLYQHLPQFLQFIERPFANLLFYTAAQGAYSSMYAAASSETEADRGLFYSNCTRTPLDAHATNAATSSALWKATVELIRSKGFQVPAAVASDSSVQ
ncbi:short-chain dehydrogenase/reductase SDR [Capsaspora owczarzaki ATCC 30864]|uniref:Short-chain dehydrogenase/reductase SDR n=1 Tax=Capsaspora owczarzaki (strain ATCC 30864) TaxID=595528 RepID=A0A0D2WKC6_CAPO3|nr:short-chain dehydrogenase/reductase SDR [Capsaspora owczarzaki ATCC 30864]KJE90675.1 short-chain dehydrogenase/reductase SDR [Capsaspora owczarzaki ATCC 30864]|eukprot:XP_004364813.2 short-chain dehydrogenase/reductase SDR [Capsaspora owczarzaki ATCC 30864]